MSSLSVHRGEDGSCAIEDSEGTDCGTITGLSPAQCMGLALALARAGREGGAHWPEPLDADPQAGLQAGLGEWGTHPVLALPRDERVGPLLDSIRDTKCELTRVMHLLSQAGDMVQAKNC